MLLRLLEKTKILFLFLFFVLNLHKVDSSGTFFCKDDMSMETKNNYCVCVYQMSSSSSTYPCYYQNNYYHEDSSVGFCQLKFISLSTGGNFSIYWDVSWNQNKNYDNSLIQNQKIFFTEIKNSTEDVLVESSSLKNNFNLRSLDCYYGCTYYSYFNKIGSNINITYTIPNYYTTYTPDVHCFFE